MTNETSTLDAPIASYKSESGWFDKPMRWAQLTLVEDDPQTFDVAFWLDYFKRIKSDAACLSAGGYMAFYPTEIPLHYRSKFLGDTDPFGELVRGCREMDMVVLARTDPHAVHQDVYEAHPDWIAVDAEGNKRKHWAMPGVWVTCPFGPYNFEFMTQVHREIMSEYAVDGIFSNRWAGSGMCYCEHCQRLFRDAYGMELPHTKDPLDLAWRNYLVWRQQRLFELCDVWDQEIRKINPNARYVPNSGGGALSELSMKILGEKSDILFADKQARSGVTIPWASGKNAKEFRATLGMKPIGGIFSIGVEEPHRWKDSVQSEAEIRVWVADATAHGMRPWFTKFAGSVYDQRWLGVVEDIYTWQQSIEPYLRNKRPLARVALVYSQQNAHFYGGEQARNNTEAPILGVYHALIEARLPFEMVHDELLDADHTDRFGTLILPNVAALSDAQCDALRGFVERGGSLVATFETSLYNEWGEKRDDFGLADLFGVRLTGATQGPMQNSYLRLETETDQAAALLHGLEGTERIINGVYRVPVEATEPHLESPLTLIPSYPDLPMEEVYPREDRTGIPEIYLREVGKGRVAYIPWDIDRAFWTFLTVDHGKLLANIVRWARAEDDAVTVTGQGVIDVAAWEQEDSMTVHLVNLTNPMMMKGPFRELIPSPEQKVTIQLPDNRSVGKVRLLKQGQEPEFELADGVLTVTVPSVEDHEIIAVDFQ